MTNAQKNSQIILHDPLDLLPWYINKSLQGEELLALEKHLSTCLVCKRELVQLEKLAQAVAHEHSFDSAETASFARLKHRLHSRQADVAKTDSVPLKKAGTNNHVEYLPANAAKTKKHVSLPVAWAMAASLLLAMLLPLDMNNNDFNVFNKFTTLSNSEVPALNTNEIRVVFADNVDEQNKNSILQRIHGQIIDQPTEQGVYTIQLRKEIGAQHLLSIVDSLRKDENIIFAEPAYAFLSAGHDGDKK